MEEAIHGMMLIYEMMVPCMIMDKRSVPDGLGGFTYDWVDGVEFKAAIFKDNTLETLIAEKQGFTESYTITVPKSTTLAFHDVVKRISDGAIFRVTSNTQDSEPPERATPQIITVNAERWELPT